MKQATGSPRHGRKAVVLVLLAGVFTGAEALVSAGIELPFSGVVPGWVRAVAIVGVTVGAFYFRWRASRS